MTEEEKKRRLELARQRAQLEAQRAAGLRPEAEDDDGYHPYADYMDGWRPFDAEGPSEDPWR